MVKWLEARHVIKKHGLLSSMQFFATLAPFQVSLLFLGYAVSAKTIRAGIKVLRTLFLWLTFYELRCCSSCYQPIS